MTRTTHPLVFDGHNDVLLKQFQQGPAARQSFQNGNDAHIDLPKARRGGFAGGFFAIHVPSDINAGDTLWDMTKPAYDVPLPPQIAQQDAVRIVLAQAAILARLEDDGAVKICTSVADIRHCLDNGKMAAIMHLEGAEGIDTNFDTLEVLFRAGLRSIGPVWSRPTAFGHGVPFRFPADPDIGDGLTEAGKKLIRRCNQLAIMVDLSHLNAAGFWDVARLSDAPLVATHSNAHAICPHARNLSDEQLAAIKDSDGMVGLNFATAFLRPDGRMRKDTKLDVMLLHLDYLIEHLGEDHVGLGSDFDGAMVPAAIGDAAGLPALREAMKLHGFDEQLMRKLCHANWLSVLERTWI